MLSQTLPLRRTLLPGKRFFSSSIHHHVPLTSFSSVWLRDSCQCPLCIHPSTKQKLHQSSDVSPDIKPVEGSAESTPDGTYVTWSDGHESFFPSGFLERHSSPQNLRNFHRDVDWVEWDVPILEKSANLFLPYDVVKTSTGLHQAITQLTRYGLLFVKDVPNEKKSDEECELRTLGERFGELRRTFYGEVWDVKAVKNSRNIAYTNVDLGLHMDLLYFQHPPRYQILHCLRNRVEGGTSIFVDAARVASDLRKSDPEVFKTLSTTPVGFHYINDGHHLHFSHPTIQLSRFPNPLTGEHDVEFINYSPPFQAPLAANTPPHFYSALRKFATMLAAPQVQYKYLLKEGDAVLFDNRRVLHARTEFKEREVESSKEETNRWLKGCYIEADAVLDRGRVLDAQLKQ
ncbi:Clavaminate synthase-like protein [Epithele typhae]|uniref:Clavaminate synthase-like protein n=1 Tax=Epithele typhae TaxID=378194 RepID=UPI002008770C|nr:Clavaminate synthase-like protein [Epithele typhae]KAH9934557.1 Clavaminate synthase-like protein [Epithele typhae]